MTQNRLLARRISNSDTGSSFERCNAVQRAVLCHRRPDFLEFWTSLQSVRGTSTSSPIAPRQNPRKLRSNESILSSFGIMGQIISARFETDRVWRLLKRWKPLRHRREGRPRPCVGAVLPAARLKALWPPWPRAVSPVRHHPVLH